ncbi:MAG TPA: ricin-type beta-trefoil lectin domain protein [Micromonosporaceae bacterium]|nr:ricin-type beta-trefoil lectin domain protein [Micromonosporaceae bacterium]
MRKKFVRIACMVGASAAVLAVAASPAAANVGDGAASRPQVAQSQTPPPVEVHDVVYLKNVALEQCLELPADPTRAWVYAENCDDVPHQRWERIKRGEDTYVLRNAADGSCLFSVYSLVTRWACELDDPRLHWTFVPGPAGTFEIKNAQSGLFADTMLIDRYGLRTVEHGAHDYQRFLVSTSVAPVRDVVQLQSAASGRCLETGTDFFASVRLADCTDAVNQRWQRVEIGVDTYVLRSVGRSTCLRGEGPRVHLRWTCELDDPREHWTFAPAIGGTVEVTNVASRLVMDTNRSTYVVAEPGNGTIQQRLQVVEVTPTAAG